MQKSWKKGALHAHSLWSDGRNLPEMVIKTYRDRGFDFVCLSDHNIFQKRENMYLPLARDEGPWPPMATRSELARLEEALPGSAVTEKIAVRRFVKLKTYEELRREFEVPGKFLVVPGEEITLILDSYPCSNDRSRGDYHINTFNLPCDLPILHGENALEAVTLNLRSYEKAAAEYPHPSFAMLNHPFGRYWDIDPRILVERDEFRHFEICNNGCDADAPPVELFSVEQFWDFVLAHRLVQGKPLLYATATDDLHFCDPERIDGFCGCELGWIMVNVPGEFTADAIVEAMDKGDYYPTTGVLLDEIDFDRATGTLRVKAQAEPGTNYRVEFITTKRDFNRSIVEKEYPHEGRYTRILPVINDTIGRTVKSVEGPEASCTMADDDLYIRAIVVSDRPGKVSRMFYPETLQAWTQPFTR
jgi:hypothetical protein